MRRAGLRLVFALSLILLAHRVSASEPQTVAETSDYTATAKHADVVAFCEQLAKAAPDVVRLSELGLSHEKRSLPLLLIADPPVATPAEAAASRKLVVFAQGGIHAGEIDGKEALLMLARDIALAKERPMLKNLIVAIAPLVNPDGNDRMAKTNRRDQNGPPEVGTRANAQGRDLNRDWIKLETPEVRAITRFFRQWNPAVVIDTHTTNGSYHRYTLTYDGPRHPGVSERLVGFVRDAMLPKVGEQLKAKTGFDSFSYGNFDRERTKWESYPAQPRYGTQYVGLRGRLGILSESYSYASFRDRVTASREFVRACLEYVAENSDTVQKLLDEAAKPAQRHAVAHQLVARPQSVTILGYETDPDGKPNLSRPKEYTVNLVDRAEATATTPRIRSYLIPPTLAALLEVLQRHGIDVRELREDIELTVESATVVNVRRSERAYQGVNLIQIETSPPKPVTTRIPAGTFVVATDQPLGRLAAVLLEPHSEDGLATWGLLGDTLKADQPFPILRLQADTSLTTAAARPLAEDRVTGKRIQPGHMLGGLPRVDFSARPAGGFEWLKDGEHYLQVKANRVWKVHAATGRVESLFDPAPLVKGLIDGLKLSRNRAEEIAQGRANLDSPMRPGFKMNSQQTGFLFRERDSLCFATFDGTRAVRVTQGADRAELPSFSPDGKRVVFVRKNDLYAVDLETLGESRLTQDGSDKIFNGKADWVYYEEIFNRSYQAYWWSPDSQSLAFLRFDDTPVQPFTVVDFLPTMQRLEETPYPKAGYPNPHVKLGVVSASGGPVRFVDVPGHKPEDTLLIRAAWTPESSDLLFYLQDRAQTWLDVMAVSPGSDGPLTARRLLRETTKAWVEDLGEPIFLKDGRFLLHSERDGWKHLYLFNRDGGLIRQVTNGPWEVRHVHLVEEKSGWIYLSTTAESPITQNLGRVPLERPGSLEPISDKGDHRFNFSPTGSFYIDTVSNHREPPTVNLRRLDGQVERRLDTNPLYDIEEYQLGRFELVKIPLKDGFVLEGSLLYPVDFDPNQKYPVWFMTYGGPHAPTISDQWSFRLLDHVLSGLGIFVFRCDPRSASGKGAASTWTTYKQLGVQEHQDVEAAIDWLIAQHPFVDATRIGMSGSSFGGYLTAYCMTHGTKFAAGISGAPVTDWKLYDSIYTERYMDTPKQNPGGYAKTSVLSAAKNLHGRLLLVHGLMDDNVHVQNAVHFMEELQRAGKSFEMMFYPRSRHGIGPQYQRHYQQLQLDFIRRTLGR